jgi:hypothetical protein
MPNLWAELLVVYTVSQTLGTSTGAWATSRLLRRQGTWTKALAGAGVGYLALVPAHYVLRRPNHNSVASSLALNALIVVLPALGATIGLNL